MKECDECGKKTEELNFQEVRLPENLEESIKDPTKQRIKIIEMWICAECKVKYDNLYKEASEFIRNAQKEVHRKWYENEGDIEDLK